MSPATGTDRAVAVLALAHPAALEHLFTRFFHYDGTQHANQAMDAKGKNFRARIHGFVWATLLTLDAETTFEQAEAATAHLIMEQRVARGFTAPERREYTVTRGFTAPERREYTVTRTRGGLAEELAVKVRAESAQVAVEHQVKLDHSGIYGVAVKLVEVHPGTGVWEPCFVNPHTGDLMPTNSHYAAKLVPEESHA